MSDTPNGVESEHPTPPLKPEDSPAVAPASPAVHVESPAALRTPEPPVPPAEVATPNGATTNGTADEHSAEKPPRPPSTNDVTSPSTTGSGFRTRAQLAIATSESGERTASMTSVGSSVADEDQKQFASPVAARPQPRKRAVEDFDFGEVLGEGSYGSVKLATERDTGRQFAAKMLDKKHIIAQKKVQYVQTEKNIMNMLDHPNIVKLYFTFQDPRRLYYIVELCPNGELFHHVRRLGSFDESCTRFYVAEIALALEHMHGRGIVHRDLKPENVLLDRYWHAKLTDFGTAKVIGNEPRARSNSFVGTAEYVSPELLEEKCCYKGSDLWALGCIVYQFLAGRPPFKAANEYQIFQKILKRDLLFPPGFPPKAQDLVEKLLVLSPDARLEDVEVYMYYTPRYHVGTGITPQTPAEPSRLSPLTEEHTESGTVPWSQHASLHSDHASPPAPTARGRDQLRVLVTDDSELIQKLTRRMLTVIGFVHITAVGDGLAAVEASREQPFDIILMDVNMPVMDGITASKIIRKQDEARAIHTLIIAMTANATLQKDFEHQPQQQHTTPAHPTDRNNIQPSASSTSSEGKVVTPSPTSTVMDAILTKPFVLDDLKRILARYNM